MWTEVIVAIITTGGIIVNSIITSRTNKKIKNIDEIKESLQAQMKDDQYQIYKTYLVDYLSEVENGTSKTEIQKERAKEIYDKYVAMGGNSYVRDKWEELKRKGLL